MGKLVLAWMVLALTVAGCETAMGPRGGRPADRNGDAALAADPMEAAAGLAPVARFLGEWEGESQSLAGNFQVARRFSWVVKDSWLLEQVVVLDPGSHQEIQRSGVLYTWDPRQRRIRALVLDAGGLSRWATVTAREDGRTLEMRLDDGSPPTLFQTLSFDGRQWQGRAVVQGKEGAWTEVDRQTLGRRR